MKETEEGEDEEKMTGNSNIINQMLIDVKSLIG